MSKGREVVAGHFPVFHAGYLQLLENHPDADVAVLGDDVLKSRFGYLRKDIRALIPEQAVAIISGLERTTRLIGETGLAAVMSSPQLVMPDDDISHALAKEFDAQPVFDPIFLRWDRKNSTVNVEVEPDRTIAIDSNDPVIKALYESQERSTNWWRHVAAAVVKNGDIIAITHNSSVPTPYSSAIDSDPRITANRGVAIETSIDMHAEARAIAGLAKEGHASHGADIYVTTFPCPNCAKLIAESGFRSCYFIEGYAMLDGQSVLQANGVDIIKVDTEPFEINPDTLKPYPTN